MVRQQIANEMQSEIAVCPWNEFWQHYSPWIPPEAVVQQGASILETANILNGGEWAEDVDPAGLLLVKPLIYMA